MKIMDHVKNKRATICPRCGKKADDDMLFCPYCGSELKNDDLILTEGENNENEGFDVSVFMHESDRKALKALKQKDRKIGMRIDIGGNPYTFVDGITNDDLRKL